MSDRLSGGSSLRLALKLSVQQSLQESSAFDNKSAEAPPPPDLTVAAPKKISREMKALAAFNVVPAKPPSASAVVVVVSPPGKRGPKGGAFAWKKGIQTTAKEPLASKRCSEGEKPKSSGKKRPRKGQFYHWEQLTDGLGEEEEEVETVEPDESTLKMVAELAKEKGGDAKALGSGSWVRRSVRASGQSDLSSRQVGELLEVITTNHKDAQVLKLKHWLGPDTNTWVMDSVLSALMKNHNCEALYIQNFNDGTHPVSRKHYTCNP
jgi:hypothetical protein